MSVLSGELRSVLERAVLEGRGVAEGACASALGRLGVGLRGSQPGHLNGGRAVAAAWVAGAGPAVGDQLGRMRHEVGWRVLVVASVAYEQWHRLLFARFLAENGLLMHPEFKAAGVAGGL